MTNYQIMPRLSTEEFAALKADIAQRGVLVPVEYDDLGNVLDGHHRIKACTELGITEWPRLVRNDMTEVEKRQHARQLNLARRHLSQAQKRELIAEQLKETPERSNRQIAAGLMVNHETVGSIRDKLEATGGIRQLDKTTGADGKARPVRSRTSASGKAPPSPSDETATPDRSIFHDPDFQMEAEAAARDIEVDRDERIALTGTDGLVADNEKLTKQVATLTRRISALVEENSALKFRVKSWRERAIAAGWKGRADG